MRLTHIALIFGLFGQGLLAADLKVEVLEKTKLEEGLTLVRKPLAGSVNSGLNHLLFQESRFKVTIRSQPARKSAKKMGVILQEAGLWQVAMAVTLIWETLVLPVSRFAMG
jgi:hypothetical protein